METPKKSEDVTLIKSHLLYYEITQHYNNI